MEEAERFAALGHLARVGVTQRGLSYRDRNVTARAADSVAEQVAALEHLARVGIAVRVLCVDDREETAGAADEVAQRCLKKTKHRQNDTTARGAVGGIKSPLGDEVSRKDRTSFRKAGERRVGGKRGGKYSVDCTKLNQATRIAGLLCGVKCRVLGSNA